MARIKLENLVKKFGSVTAVAGVSFDIDDGEFMIMVGPSGCGKTTTLNMISGLETPTSGTLMIGERLVNDLDPGERGLGMVFQDLALFPHMTVFENVAFGLRVNKVADSEVRQRVQKVTETMKISHLLSKKPGQCSGGEAQRVALARTIITNPDVLLMDEPLSSLDAKLRIDMRTELKRLHEALKSTFVYVTHDQAEAMTMADRIVVMRDGHIQQIGTPLEIYRTPVNQFVATFFGTPTMNMISGRISAGENPLFQSEQFELSLRRDTVPASAFGRKVNLGIRSEHIRMGSAGVRGEIKLLEPLGNETLVFFTYGADPLFVAKTSADQEYRVGDSIHFDFNPNGVLFFDAEDGKRLE
ncbi:MAG: ABC transporter ATP-binding protein [bacterium]|nr:ABC transporter ATP-binding protein [bacterium]